MKTEGEPTHNKNEAPGVVEKSSKDISQPSWGWGCSPQIAAVLLSGMAVVVSVCQAITGFKQFGLISIQTEIAERRLENERRNAAIQKTADWQRFRNSVWEILDLYPPSGVAELDKIGSEAMVSWFDKVKRLLDAQCVNPVLIENRTCLGHWRNAISSAKIAKDLIQGGGAPGPNFCSVKATSVLKDVSYVWEKLVLDSDEVSATGGRPTEAGEVSKTPSPVPGNGG